MDADHVRRHSGIDALILAGGQNKRIPVPKGLLIVDGERLIDRNVRLLRRACDRVFISTDRPDVYFYTGALLVGDTLPQRGPMTGICSALNIPDVSLLFVVACDMPFINVILMQRLIGEWDKRWDAVVPMHNGKPEPLFALYGKRCAALMEERVKGGDRSVQRFLRTVRVRFVTEDEVRKYDPEGRTFVSINTPEDYRRETGGDICSD